MLEKVIVELNNPYPIYTEHFLHELDDYAVDVYFTKNGQPFDLLLMEEGGDFSVKIAMTISDVIVTDDVAFEQTSDNKGVRMWLTTNVNLDYEIFAGLMKVEIKITDTSTTPDTVFYPICPLLVNVKPSILDNATIDEHSEGTVADLMRLYPDLNSLVTNGVGYDDLATALKNKIDGKLDLFADTSTLVTKAQLGTSTYTNPLKAYYIRLAADVIHMGQQAGLAVWLFNINNCQFLLTENGNIVYRTYSNSTWSAFLQPWSDLSARVTALENTVGTLNTQLENALNGVT